MRSTKGYFGPPVARLRRQSSAGGILDGNTPSVSVRIRTLIAPISDVCPVRHLFLRDSEGRNKKRIDKKCYGGACRLVRSVLPPMPMVS